MTKLNTAKPHLKPDRSRGHAVAETDATDETGGSLDPFAALTLSQIKYFRRKYLLDRVLGALLLTLMSPLTLLLYLLVRLTSHGPGFYRQERMGLDGKSFQIIKLRSMVSNAERPGRPVWCVKNDSRVTPLGRLLRKLHLDELPQLWNVVKGDMSLVGPRPERPEICRKLAQEIDGYYRRNLVKPGVTGLAQINLPPDESVEDVRRKQILDLLYIEQANLWLDLRMIFATALRLTGLSGETVMRSMRLCRRDFLRRECQRLSLDFESETTEDDFEPALVCAMATAGVGTSGIESFDDEHSMVRHPR